MASIKLICFKVTRVANPFRFSQNLNPFSQPMFPVDWSLQQSNQLSSSLNNQIKNNYMELEALRFSCDSLEPDMFTVETINNEVHIKTYSISKSQKAELCGNFIKRFKDYVEVISRDQDALEQYNFNVKLYAVILLYNDIYQGHIYTWISPSDKNYCLAMGIRNRVDAIFTKDTNTYLNKVSHYLLEGVRRFALAKGSIHLIVVHPRPIMEQILPTIGFQVTRVSPMIIGRSIAPVSFLDYTNCYQLLNILQPIINQDMTFSLSD